MTRKQKRGWLIGGGVVALSLAGLLVMFALRDTVVFFFTPTEAAAHNLASGQRFRLGGLVEKDSLKRGDGLEVKFVVSDGTATLSVRYKGVLPDLFREGQGVIAEGRMNSSGIFDADTVLAKHDERYMPPEVAKALKAKGVWQDAPPAKTVQATPEALRK